VRPLSRRLHAQKRGGAFEITALEMDVVAAEPAAGLEELSAALDDLAAVDPRLAQSST
jgi:hypothetical protein